MEGGRCYSVLRVAYSVLSIYAHTWEKTKTPQAWRLRRGRDRDWGWAGGNDRGRRVVSATALPGSVKRTGVRLPAG